MSVIDYLLFRFSSHTDSSLGAIFKLFPDKKEFKCFTLEDEYRKVKVPKETRIYAGRHELKLRTVGGMNERYTKKYDWHRGMLWLQDTRDFEWIYLHPGIHDDHTDGCILTGDSVTQNITKAGRLSGAEEAYKRLYTEIVHGHLLQGDRVFLDVRDFA